MVDARSKTELLKFLDYLAAKGLLPKATVQNRKAAVNAVLGVLSGEEGNDVAKIDLDQVMVRFSNLQGSKYTPASMNTYGSRVRTAIDDFVRYQQNPLGFKPTGGAIAPRKKANPEQTNQASVDQPKPSPQWSSATPVADASILPIPLRPGLVVFVQGLPHDLTRAEANKVANVIKAFAADADE